MLIFLVTNLGQKRQAAPENARHQGVCVQSAPRLLTPVLGSGFLWLLGLGGIGLAAVQLGGSLQPQQQQQELNPEEANQILEALINVPPLAIVVLDSQGRVLLWNPAAENIFGWQASEVVGLPPPFHSRNLQLEFQKSFTRSLQGEQISGVETCRHRNGMALNASFSMFPLYGSQAELNRVMLVMEDITERRLTEEELFKANEKLKVWIFEFSRRNRDLTMLNEMGDLLQTCNTEEEAYACLCQYFPRLFSRESGALFRYHQDKNLMVLVDRWGEYSPGVEKFSPEACWALRMGQEYLVQDPGSGLLCEHLAGLSQGYMCIPMIAHGETMGMLLLYKNFREDTPGEILSESKKRLAITAAKQTALSLANLKLRSSLQEQAIRDPLTGLFNRRYLEEILEREIFRVRRKGAPLSIIMLDLDLFKNINTAFGHDGGDALIQAVGEFLGHQIRREDIACRYGGEEFIVILPEATLETALARAEEMRQGVQDLQVMYQDQSMGPVTASLGVAAFPDHGVNGEELIRAADSALYRAKEEGRNRVVIPV